MLSNKINTYNSFLLYIIKVLHHFFFFTAVNTVIQSRTIICIRNNEQRIQYFF